MKLQACTTDEHDSRVSESAYEDEEEFARGGTTPGEGVVGEEDDGPGGGGANFPLRMAANTARGRITAVGGFLRGAGQHVNFDPEAPPPPPNVAQQQTTGLLERPEVDKKVKVPNKHNIQFRSLRYVQSASNPSRRAGTKRAARNNERPREPY